MKFNTIKKIYYFLSSVNLIIGITGFMIGVVLARTPYYNDKEKYVGIYILSYFGSMFFIMFILYILNFYCMNHYNIDLFSEEVDSEITEDIQK